ncbi:anti-sigma regulatory factor [Pseudanabaena sp. UWO311]|uniref:ATP-binding protein n=1 Tax=Pseudanabaena sp. UWO311 TaxID=2487337 RepID=UPI0011596639|nr:anti-sigma regulatory factor [Pseudanabaena sp. UWO311]TYQ25237.1 anti-sigma regulatory factor [Pseudanabaena sp. UWO311]
MTQTIFLQVTTSLSDLVHVLNWFEQLPHTSVPNADWLRCKTALAEVFTNSVRHAHRDMSSETPISLEASLTDSYIEIKVFDFGTGFDLSEKLSKIDEVDVMALGGRGLDLISQMVDVFTYDKISDGRSCMKIVRYYVPIS